MVHTNNTPVYYLYAPLQWGIIWITPTMGKLTKKWTYSNLSLSKMSQVHSQIQTLRNKFAQLHSFSLKKKQYSLGILF